MSARQPAPRTHGLLIAMCGAWLEPAERAVVLGDLAESRTPRARSLVDIAGLAARRQLALWAWSWTAGFSLASLSRRALWLTGSIFVLALFAGTLGTTTSARGIVVHGLFATHFYGVVLPRLFRAGLVLVPAVLGARAAGRGASAPLRGVLVAAVAALLLTAALAPRVEGAVSYGRNTPWAGPGPDGFRGSDDDPRPISLRLIPLGLAWPAAFTVGLTIRRTHKNDGINR